VRAAAAGRIRALVASMRAGGGRAAQRVTTVGRGAGTSMAAASSSLYDKALDQVLVRPHVVATVEEAAHLLGAAGGESRAMTEQIQQVVVLAAPLLRRLSKTGRLPGVRRIPFVFTAATAAALASQLRSGLREVQVIGAYLATRIERATGRPADPDLVKRATVELYLSPNRPPSLANRRPRAGGLAVTWLVRGFFGRDTALKASKALGAVEALDVEGLVTDWGRQRTAIDVDSYVTGQLPPAPR
jgi:hypothetical protein